MTPSHEATPRGPKGARLACNLQDARNFVIICRIDCTVPTEAVRDWALSMLQTLTHVAAYDTFSRKQSALQVRMVREMVSEVYVLVRLVWEGRQYLDLDALIMTRETPRSAPVMNAAEILHVMSTSQPFYLRSLGVSGVSRRVIDPLWNDSTASETWVLKLQPTPTWVAVVVNYEGDDDDVAVAAHS